MVAHPQGKFARELANDTSSGYNGLQLLINNCNRGTGSTHPLKIAYTEINVTYKNPTLSSESSTSIYENTFDGIACRSFFGGQWLMEMFCSFFISSSDKAAFMIPWSIHESGGDGDLGDLSITRGTASSTAESTPVSTYYHYEMLADNLRNCTHIRKATSTTNSIKAFGGYNTLTGANGKFAVFLINQTATAVSNFKVQLDATSQTGSYALMGFPNGPNAGYTLSTLAANSTVVLVFNVAGTLLRKIEYNLANGKNSSPAYSDFPVVSGSPVVMIDLGPDKTGCCGVTLSASPTISGATYAWSRAASDFTTTIGTNSTYNVPSGTSDTYKCTVTYSGQTAWDYVKGNHTSPSCCRLSGLAGTEVDENETFYAIPNPTEDAATIKYTLPEYASEGTITIADYTGKTLKTIRVSNKSESVDVDFRNLSNGVYFYSLHASEKLISSKKLVIVK